MGRIWANSIRALLAFVCVVPMFTRWCARSCVPSCLAKAGGPGRGYLLARQPVVLAPPSLKAPRAPQAPQAPTTRAPVWTGPPRAGRRGTPRPAAAPPCRHAPCARRTALCISTAAARTFGGGQRGGGEGYREAADGQSGRWPAGCVPHGNWWDAYTQTHTGNNTVTVPSSTIVQRRT